MRRSGPHEPTEEEIQNAFKAPTPAPNMVDTGAVKPMDDTAILPSLAPPRDEAKVLSKIKALAAAAGSDWFYSFPVTDHATGRKTSIEGATIKCANNVARIFGNCIADCRLGYETSDAWIFYARFVDRETGYALVRAFQQRKGQQAMKTKDPGRVLDMVFQIGQSKAIRNVICNALETFTNFAFEEAKNSLVDRIGAKLPESIKWAENKLTELGVSIDRVQAVRGRPSSQWTAHDVALVYAELQAVFDGMSHADDLWPPKQPPVGGATPEPTKTAEDVRKSNEDLEGGAKPAAATPAAQPEQADKQPEGEKPKPAARTRKKAEDAAPKDPPKPPADAEHGQRWEDTSNPDQPVKKRWDEAGGEWVSEAEFDQRHPEPPKPAATAKPQAKAADEAPRKVPYKGPPGRWVDQDFVPLLKKMGRVEHVDRLCRENEQNLLFVRKQDPEAYKRMDDAISMHRKDLVDAGPPPGDDEHA